MGNASRSSNDRSSRARGTRYTEDSSSLDVRLIRAAGQISYESRISGRRESLPVCVSLMGLPGRVSVNALDACPDHLGTDLELIDLVRSFLEQTGRPTEMMVGRDMFVRHT